MAERTFLLATIVLLAASVALACSGLKGPGGFLADELPILLWIAGVVVLGLWVFATAGRLVNRRYAKPHRPDGPEADYHDPDGEMGLPK